MKEHTVGVLLKNNAVNRKKAGKRSVYFISPAADLYLFKLCLPAFRCCFGHATFGKVLSFTVAALPLERCLICCVAMHFVYAEGRERHAPH